MQCSAAVHHTSCSGVPPPLPRLVATAPPPWCTPSPPGAAQVTKDTGAMLFIMTTLAVAKTVGALASPPLTAV